MMLDPDPLHVDDERIPSSKPYRLVPDSPRRGCSVLGFLVILLLIGSATPRAASEPVAAAGELRAVQGQPGAPLVNVTGKPTDPTLDERPVLHGRRDQSDAAGRVRAAVRQYSGLATWFPASGYQAAVPWWKPGQDPLVVAVSAFRDGRTYSTSVLVTGWCACGDRDGLPTVIDLSPRAFAELAPLSVGVISVQVELPTQGPVLPATSTDQ